MDFQGSKAEDLSSTPLLETGLPLQRKASSLGLAVVRLLRLPV